MVTLLSAVAEGTRKHPAHHKVNGVVLSVAGTVGYFQKYPERTERMVQPALTAIVQTLRGIAAAIRSRPRIVLAAAGTVTAFNLLAPIVVLSIARKPVDFFTFNPWLRRLPEYLHSSEPLEKKLSFVSSMAIGWASADNAGGEGVEWGFVLDVPTLGRILLTSLVFGTFFALWSYRRRQDAAGRAGFDAARPAGIAGAVTSVVGLTTGPCSLSGCGVPVLPVLALAFTGLTSGTLTLISQLSRISFVVISSLMAVAILWFGWKAGTAPRPPPSVARDSGASGIGAPTFRRT
jgi:hypothetical protein